MAGGKLRLHPPPGADRRLLLRHGPGHPHQHPGGLDAPRVHGGRLLHPPAGVQAGALQRQDRLPAACDLRRHRGHRRRRVPVRLDAGEAAPRDPRPARSADRRRGAAVRRQRGDDHLQGQGAIGHPVDAPGGGDLPVGPVPFRHPLLQGPERRLLLLVVGDPPLGGGRLGADHGRHRRLRHPGGDRGRTQGRGEVAVRGDGALPLHRASSVRAITTTGSAPRTTGSGGGESSAPWSRSPSR